MKHTILKLIIISIFLNSMNLSNSTEKPDFNYPKTVSENALADIKNASVKGDKPLLVDAILRYSKAQQLISDDNAKEVIDLIEKHRVAETQPDYKAIFALIEIDNYKYFSVFRRSLDNEELHEQYPDDLTEWNELDFKRKNEELRNLVLENKAALHKHKLNEYAKFITVPTQSKEVFGTLLDFAYSKLHTATNDPALLNEWLNESNSNITTTIYIKWILIENKRNYDYSERSQDFLALYKQYAQFEQSGMALREVKSAIENYDTFKQYVERFPKSRHTPSIKNKIFSIEQKTVSLEAPFYYNSINKIPVTINNSNSAEFSIAVYTAIETKNSRYSRGQLIKTYKISNNTQQPFHNDTTTLYIDPLPYGEYLIEPVLRVGKKEVRSEYFSKPLCITDISSFRIATAKGSFAYAVNSTTGKPIKGTSLYKGDTLIGKTDAEGKVMIKNSKNTSDSFDRYEYEDWSRNYRFIYGKDKYSNKFGSANLNENSYGGYSLTTFTDLAIYRPGETVKYSAIIFKGRTKEAQLLNNAKITVSFDDSNYKTIATDTLTTDNAGRISGEFVVPADRMNGSFRITFRYEKEYLGAKTVEVSEYKTPTFEITLNNPKRSYNLGEDVVITGKAVTYAGMPVANAPVSIKLVGKSWFFWMRDISSNVHSDTVTTNANGEFTITLSPDKFEENGNNKERIARIYNFTAECTNNTGETQSCNHSFFVGTHRRIMLNDELTFINDKPISLPVTIESSDDADRNFTCNYTLTSLTDSTQVITSGTFSSGKPEIDLQKVPSGTYNITVTDASGLAEEAKSQITIYRESDTACPVEANLWVPECGRKACDDNVARITLGTSNPEIYVYYCASSNEGIEQGWKKYSSGLHTLELPMPKADNERLEVSLITVCNSQLSFQEFTLITPARKVNAVVEATSFRDKLTPGNKERWTFRILDNHGRPLSGAALLAITDKAINSIAPNIWAFNKPHFQTLLTHNLYLTLSHNYSCSANWRDYVKEKGEPIYNPEFNYSNFSSRFDSKRLRMFAKHEPVCMNLVGVSERDFGMSEIYVKGTDEILADGAVAEECGSSAENEAEANTLNNIQLRENAVKTALWMPNLVTDEQGNYEVEFEVPNFNTTWLVQTLAYTANGYFAGLQRDAVSSKPIMVKANMPRFLRAGDKATLAANVANKSDESAAVNGIIELFDPRTGNVIASKSFNLTLEAMRDAAVSIDYTADADASFIGFRIKASNGSFGDGEQVMVPILSNISPVIETMPFFINANNADFTAQLPKMKGAEKAAIEYCDNPVWYCATALPTIFDKDAKTSTQLAHSLFALKLAQGLAKQNPQMDDAIAYWKQQDRETSPLTSALERNSDLKIGTLLASPWINEADRQILQMGELDKLFNNDYCAKSYDEIVSRLSELQLPDGGFSWIHYRNCKSSLYCTGEVLETLGRLKKLGHLNADRRLNEIIAKAVKYYDSEHLKLFNKLKKNDSMIWYDDYAFVRTLYPEIAMPEANKAYVKRILSDIEKGWKDHSLARKAFFALTLQNNGKPNVARQITESIRQFSITTEQRGMYWDRIDGAWWRGRNQLAVTSVILQALQQVDNRTNEIDQIRKWILLNKQTNDWGGSSLASEAVYTILSTGSKWLTPGKTPAISIGSTPVIFDEIDRYLGYSRKELAVADVMDKTLSISRGQATSPAWGALYLQGKSPMKSIKSARVDDLSIEKTLLVHNADGTLSKATSLKVGDKVRVQCTIKCGKALEYLTLTDERGACFEPVDKTSDSDYMNGVWMYRETKDSQTNIFIPWLNKGTYVIGYDVYVTNPGSFDVGIATIQCQYAPQFTAHSAGCNVVIK